MPTTINGQTYYRTAEVCRIAGISRNTLFRWLREGLFTGVERRDYRGWRLFTQGQVDAINDRVTRVVTLDLAAGSARPRPADAPMLPRRRGVWDADRNG